MPKAIRGLRRVPADYTDGAVHKMFHGCSNWTIKCAMTGGRGRMQRESAGPARRLQHSSGMVVHAYRLRTPGFSNRYCCSNDDAHTPDPLKRNLDNGVLTAGDSGVGDLLVRRLRSSRTWLLHEFS